jgi:hypothetical protein
MEYSGGEKNSRESEPTSEVECAKLQKCSSVVISSSISTKAEEGDQISSEPKYISPQKRHHFSGKSLDQLDTEDGFERQGTNASEGVYGSYNKGTNNNTSTEHVNNITIKSANFVQRIGPSSVPEVTGGEEDSEDRCGSE